MYLGFAVFSFWIAKGSVFLYGIEKYPDGRECFIRLMMKKNKLSIFCSNTCRIETKLINGQPNPEFTWGIGVYSIIRTAEKYNGEYDFKNNQRVFVFRLIMNTEPVQGGEG